jgi:hypothetical protein
MVGLHKSEPYRSPTSLRRLENRATAGAVPIVAIGRPAKIIPTKIIPKFIPQERLARCNINQLNRHPFPKASNPE